MEYFGLNIFKILRYWASTQLLVFRYWLKVMLPKRALLKKTRALRGSKKGKCALVLANGPSVSKLDPEKVLYLQKHAGVEVFVVNSYIKSEMASTVRPDFYVLSDPTFFGIPNLNHVPERAAEVKKEVPEILKTGAKFFVPVEYHAYWTGNEAYAFCDVQDFFSSNTTDILKARGYHTLTAYKALAAALYQGYDLVYICGFDNDYFKSVTVDAENQMYHLDNHFYQNDVNPSGTTRWKVLKTDSRSVGELLYNLHFNFKHLEKFADSPVINLDPDSLVDCFSKQHKLDIYREACR